MAKIRPAAATAATIAKTNQVLLPEKVLEGFFLAASFFAPLDRIEDIDYYFP
jgi:hypothetical protein